jgi:small RNA 2'-O-methyltransferase
MVLISLSSNNPDLSRVIEKNPSNPIVIKKIRVGNSFGYYTKNNYCPINDKTVLGNNYFEGQVPSIPKDTVQTYLVVFKEGSGETSYKHSKEDNYDYMNSLKYSSANCILNMIGDYYKSLFKYEKNEEDNYIYSFYFNLLFFKKYDLNIINHFKKYFDYIKFDCLKYNNDGSDSKKGNYCLIISSNNPQELVKICYLLFVILSTEDDDFMIDDAMTGKLVNILASTDSPYYIRNITLSKIINSESKYNKLIDIINNSNKNKLSLVFGNNQQNRISFAKTNICNNSNIIDFGCGEGAYAIALVKKADNYLCFDTDPCELNKARRKVYNRSIDKKTSKEISEKYKNICYFSEQDKLFEKIHSDIIMLPDTFVVFSEVIEHIELIDAKRILDDILSLLLTNPSIKIILTTPNRDFNHNYLIDGFRHDDHKFEFTKNEFIDFMNESIQSFNDSQENVKIKYDYHGIGDSVDDVFTVQGAIIHN